MSLSASICPELRAGTRRMSLSCLLMEGAVVIYHGHRRLLGQLLDRSSDKLSPHSGPSGLWVSLGMGLAYRLTDRSNLGEKLVCSGTLLRHSPTYRSWAEFAEWAGDGSTWLLVRS